MRRIELTGVLSLLAIVAASVPADRPIACDRKGNHPHGGNVLFFDGSVRFLTGEEYDEALKMMDGEAAPAAEKDK